MNLSRVFLALMTWNDLEKIFIRSFLLSCSRSKIQLAFPGLLLCGVFLVFCRAIAFEASEWISFSLSFLPILLSAGLLLSLGALLIRLHIREVKRLSIDLKELFVDSADLWIGTSYLSIPPVLAYLCLWIVMGLFLLFQKIPGLGSFFSVILAFGPFLLLLASLLLCVASVFLLFFVAPAIATQSLKRTALLKQVGILFCQRPLTNLALFLLALFPVAVWSGLLVGAAHLTGKYYLIGEHSLSVGLEWFFIMLPFCALLTPALIFFFNFAAESYQLLQTSSSKHS